MSVANNKNEPVKSQKRAAKRKEMSGASFGRSEEEGRKAEKQDNTGRWGHPEPEFLMKK
jgi:hypothetical protein